MVFQHAHEHPSQWPTIRSVAESWAARQRRAALGAAGRARWRQASRLTTPEREELKRLEREVVELKRANEILKKAAAFFAQAELDRRAK
jgi:transposase